VRGRCRLQRARKRGDDEIRDLDASKVPRFGRLPLAVLLKRVFLTDALTCPKCQGRMKILAVITDAAAIRKILVHLDISSEAPRRTPARPPPQAELAGLSDDIDVDYADPSGPKWRAIDLAKARARRLVACVWQLLGITFVLRGMPTDDGAGSKVGLFVLCSS
jgi:hypothetical protein